MLRVKEKREHIQAPLKNNESWVTVSSFQWLYPSPSLKVNEMKNQGSAPEVLPADTVHNKVLKHK